MRGRTRFVAMVVGGLLLLPATAGANGGAFFEVRGPGASGSGGTHFLPGGPATASTYVSIPSTKRSLLDRGPFHGYLLPEGDALREGRPVPADAVRLGTFVIERDRGSTFVLELEFTVPDVPSGIYSIAMCNDPCTLSGLREPLAGTISIVETAREGDLLTQQYRLETTIWRLRRDVRRAERRLEETTAQLAQSQEDNAVLGELVNDARDGLGVVPSPVPAAIEAEERPLVDGRVLIAAALLLVVAAALRRRRRPAPAEIPSPNGKASAPALPRSDWSDLREPAGRNR